MQTQESLNLETKALEQKWFYEFILPSGRKTKLNIPDFVAQIHTTRLAMMNSILEPYFMNKWPNTTAIDIACHEGYFATQLAKRGCKRVVGIDARPENIQKATLMRNIYQYTNLNFLEGNLKNLNSKDFEPADIVLMFGLLYHLEDPIGAIRFARALTKKICLIETQVAPSLSGLIEWGSCYSHKDIKGTFTLIDEIDEVDCNKEASTTGISLCPSTQGLTWILGRFFPKIQIVPPIPNGHEQLVSGNRIMIAAYC